MNFRFSLLLSSMILYTLAGFGQGMPIGYWRSHLPYNNAISAATNGVTIFAASDMSLFTYNKASNEISTYSKSEGMSDVGIAYVAYDEVTDQAVIAYKNGNIDLFRDNSFFNIPDIRLKSITPKNINHIYTTGGMAYLSTSFGVVVLNLSKRETRETYTFTLNNKTLEVRSFTAAGTYFYAVTNAGVFRANKNAANLQDLAAWKLLDSATNLISTASSDSKVFVAASDSMFVVSGDTLAFVYLPAYSINRIEPSPEGLFIEEYDSPTNKGAVRLYQVATDAVTDSFIIAGKPANAFQLADGSLWVADALNGLCYRTEDQIAAFVKPQGPAAAGAYDILPYNGDVWVAHGGYDENWTYIYNGYCLSHYNNGSWTTYTGRNFQPFNQADFTDVIALAKDPVDGTLYAASYRSGLFELHTDGTWQLYRESPYTEVHFIDFTSYRVSGLAFDDNRNLWITNFGGVKELAVKTPEGKGYKYRGGGTQSSAAYVLVDDNNLKWYILPAGVDGVAAYDENYTLDNTADDRYIKISASRFGLSSVVNCIAKDQQNEIWIGTNDGIGVISCSPDQVFAGNCEIRKPIVQYDQFAGYLFQNEKVKTIAVDGANRKWIGTTNGVWLISPEGDKIIYRFTAENSPLPSNNIQKIAVDPVTGDVYIGTASGLVSYRGTATEGAAVNETVTTFPNPVPSGYSGTIAIKGLVENADVRITDISGQLIYRTKALGGQAVWNGLDYTGHRPQSGVYLIFITNKDGSQTHVGKMVFME